MCEGMSDPTPPPAAAAPQASPPRRGRRVAWFVAAAALIVIGAVVGLMTGRSMADENRERDERAASRASEQEDAARDRRDFLDTHVKWVDQQTKDLPKVVADAPLLGSEKSTANVDPGDRFSVDGGDYRLRGLRIVDEFESKDPRRPAKERDGYRWALVDLDYTNRTKDSTAPACGTMGTVHLILDDRSVVDEVSHEDEEPPVHEDTYDTCGNNLDPGKSGRWVAPVRVPEDAKVAGVLVADVYARTTDSSFNVVAGKMGWMRLDDEVDVGSQGDDDTELTFVDDDSEDEG